MSTLEQLKTHEITLKHSVARCFGQRRPQHPRAHDGHGVTWKKVAGANLDNLRCPRHDTPLYQTTSGWTGAYEWDVIPPATVKAAAKAEKTRRAAKVQSRVNDGKTKLVRDLQPGDLFEVRGRGNLRSGKVVEIRKEGQRYVVVVSKQYDTVVQGYGISYRRYDDPADPARIAELESLTYTGTSAGDREVVVDLESTWSGKHWLSPDFRGWAVEQPQCVTEYWNNEVNRLTGLIEGGYNNETNQAQLQVAIDRLVVHTGSAATSA